MASEAFEYLLGCQEIDGYLRDTLWAFKASGFEAALAQVQQDAKSSLIRVAELKKLQNAILRMFKDMDEGFVNIGLENALQPDDKTVANFLTRFDAIFTLNQDLLLERRYLNGSIAKKKNSKWGGWQMPGVVRSMDFVAGPHDGPHTGKWFVKKVEKLDIQPNLQPFIKLHGSSNWYANESEEVLVMGADKASTIKSSPILKANYDYFVESLSHARSRLMVIGYSFGDLHINSVLMKLAREKSIEIFVIDPMGVDVMDKNSGTRMAIYQIDRTAAELWPCVIGASRRSVRDIFGKDYIEYGKVMKFFE